MPGTFATCDGDSALVCNALGNSYDSQTCMHGCDGSRGCLGFIPSNGLGPPLVDSQHEAEAVLPAGTRIDTDAGLIQNAMGTQLAVKTMLLSQVAGPDLRVFEGRSFKISDVTVVGTLPVAFAAIGTISVEGRVVARATGVVGGPGAQASAPCAGELFISSSGLAVTR